MSVASFALDALLAGVGIALEFGDIAGEATCRRTQRALFDFSFMSCARVSGGDARGAIASITQRPFDRLA